MLGPEADHLGLRDLVDLLRLGLAGEEREERGAPAASHVRCNLSPSALPVACAA